MLGYQGFISRSKLYIVVLPELSSLTFTELFVIKTYSLCLVVTYLRFILTIINMKHKNLRNFLVVVQLLLALAATQENTGNIEQHYTHGVITRQFHNSSMQK